MLTEVSRRAAALVLTVLGLIQRTQQTELWRRDEQRFLRGEPCELTDI